MFRNFMMLAAVFTIPACSGANEGEQDGAGEQKASAVALSGGAEASASTTSERGSAREVSIENDLFEFAFSYPKAVGAIPLLKTMFDAKVLEAQGEITKQAREANQDAKKFEYTYRPHSLSEEWKVVADMPRWLSLSASIATYSGGAHGNYGKDSVLWDKQGEKLVQPLELFQSAGALEAAVAADYCDKLNLLRTKRLNWEGVAAEDTPTTCPELKELLVLIGSSNNKTFNRIGLYAAPYVAGSYAEGDYEVTLPVTKTIMDAVRPEFRGAFSLGS